MMAAVHRRDTDVEERWMERWISHLKKVCHREFGLAGILVRETKFSGESGPGDRIPQFSATEIMVRPWGNRSGE